MALTALITGASGGIGRPLARRLRERGYRVMATDTSLPDVAADATRVLDVRSLADWTAALAEVVARWGRLDVLVNVAGIARAGQFATLGEDEIERHFEVNVQGAIRGVHVVLPQMLEQRRGHIVNIGSLAAVAPVPGIALYSATKFALRGFSLALATELAASGVAVTTVHPDLVDTAMIAPQVDQPDAAYSFSGARALDASEVADALITALDERPLEVFLPTSRGLMCRLVGAFPRLGQALAPRLKRRGLERQARVRDRRDADPRSPAHQPARPAQGAIK